MQNPIFDQLTFHLEAAKSLLNKITPPDGTITFSLNNRGVTVTEIESDETEFEIGYVSRDISTAVETLDAIFGNLNSPPGRSRRANHNKHDKRKIV